MYILFGAYPNDPYYATTLNVDIDMYLVTPYSPQLISLGTLQDSGPAMGDYSTFYLETGWKLVWAVRGHNPAVDTGFYRAWVCGYSI